MPCSRSFTLAFDVLSDYFEGRSACCDQAEAFAPEGFLPQLLPNLWELLLDQSAACAFIGVKEFGYFRIRMGRKQHMDMIFVMVPLFDADIVGILDMLEDFF